MGRGHAVPDALIGERIRRLAVGVELTFVSYATGARTLRDCGERVVDLGLSEDPPMPQLLLAAASVLTSIPDRSRLIVVAHEEFAVLPIAKRAGVDRVLMMIDWVPPAGTFQAKCLDYADEIIFLDEPGHYQIPAHLSPHVQYVGRVCGGPSVAARESGRRQWGIAESTAVAIVAPGGTMSHSEAATPVCELILDAWERVPFADKRLLWVANDLEHAALLRHPRASSLLTIVAPHGGFADTLAACDVVITKGNRITTFEAEEAGVPSISISYATNPVDDHRITSIANNAALRADRTTAEALALEIEAAIDRRRRLDRGPAVSTSAAKAAALILANRQASPQEPHALSTEVFHA